MKKRYYKINPSFSVKLVVDFNGIELFGERVFTLVYPALGINQTFRIESLSAEPGFHKISVQATSVEPQSLQWNATLEEGVAPSIPAPISTSIGPQTPVILSTTVGNSGGIQALVSWSNSVTGNQTQEAQFKLTSASTWTPLSLAADQRSVMLTGLTASVSYDFEVRSVDPVYGVSVWAITSFTSTASAGTTGALVSATAVGATNVINLAAQQNASSYAAYIQVAVMASGVGVSWASPFSYFAGASQSITKQVSETAATYDVYFRSVGVNGDLGAVLSVIGVVVTAAVTTVGATHPDTASRSGNTQTTVAYNPTYNSNPFYGDSNPSPPGNGLY